MKGFLLLTLGLLMAPAAYGGRTCGADGHWLSPLIPERWGRARFTSACRSHDECYSTCGRARRDCDRVFHSDLRNSCKQAYGHWTKRPYRESCLRVVAGYYSAVYRNGGDAYRSAQREQGCP